MILQLRFAESSKLEFATRWRKSGFRSIEPRFSSLEKPFLKSSFYRLCLHINVFELKIFHKVICFSRFLILVVIILSWNSRSQVSKNNPLPPALSKSDVVDLLVSGTVGAWWKAVSFIHSFIHSRSLMFHMHVHLVLISYLNNVLGFTTLICF